MSDAFAEHESVYPTIVDRGIVVGLVEVVNEVLSIA